MVANLTDNKLNLEMSRDEALVISEWLYRFNAQEGNDNLFEHEAEQNVLWRIEGALEKVIPEVFDKNYSEILDQARNNCR